MLAPRFVPIYTGCPNTGLEYLLSAGGSTLMYGLSAIDLGGVPQFA